MIKTTFVAVIGIASLSMANDAPSPSDAPTPAVIRKFSKFDTMIDSAVHDATQTRQSDPLKFISQDMHTVSGDLAEYQTDKPVQAQEDKVVSQLDVVIKQLEEACKKSGPGGNLNPSRPMADSRRGGGPGGIHDLTDPKASDKQWGNLSPKQRDQILQSKTDGFPPGYETLLQSYYKRLAQEQVTDDKSPDKSTDKSAAPEATAAIAPATNAPIANAPTTAPSK